MHAFLLAGGKGVRLRPYTTALPKPLVPIGDKYPIIEIVLMQLASRGFKTVTISIGYLGELIRAYVGDGSKWGLDVDYVTEDEPLGTMGPVVSSLDGLPEHFLVMNGDVLTDLDYSSVLDHHVKASAPLTISTFSRSVRVDFGVLRSESDRVVAFEEKPSLHYSVSMGVYGLSRSTLERYEPGKPFGFDELVLDLLKRGAPPRTQPFDGFWLDIGRPEDYDRANLEFATLSETLLPQAAPLSEATPLRRKVDLNRPSAAHAVRSTAVPA
mgnify:CR=1 FL=1